MPYFQGKTIHQIVKTTYRNSDRRLKTKLCNALVQFTSNKPELSALHTLCLQMHQKLQQNDVAVGHTFKSRLWKLYLDKLQQLKLTEALKIFSYIAAKTQEKEDF